MKPFRTLRNLSRLQRFWLIPLYLLSGPAWLLTLIIPYRRMGWLIGNPYGNTQLSLLVDRQQQIQAKQIGRLVEALCKYTPWPAKCLVQALITRFALSFHGIPHLIHIGIKKPLTPNSRMPSHAWLSVGPSVITGRDGHRQFKVLATFVSWTSLTGSQTTNLQP